MEESGERKGLHAFSPLSSELRPTSAYLILSGPLEYRGHGRNPSHSRSIPVHPWLNSISRRVSATLNHSARAASIIFRAMLRGFGRAGRSFFVNQRASSSSLGSG